MGEGVEFLLLFCWRSSLDVYLRPHGRSFVYFCASHSQGHFHSMYLSLGWYWLQGNGASFLKQYRNSRVFLRHAIRQEFPHMTCYLQQGDCQKRCAHTADISGGEHGPPRQWKWEVFTTVLTFDGFLKGEEATKIYSTISSVPKNTHKEPHRHQRGV